MKRRRTVRSRELDASSDASKRKERTSIAEAARLSSSGTDPTSDPSLPDRIAAKVVEGRLGKGSGRKGEGQ